MEPSCLALHRSGELEERARRALSLLGGPKCEVCPRFCSVDRLADERGLCRIGRRAVVASHFPHFGEENCLRGWRGSGTIFFAGCNLRCVFCLPPGTLIATEEGPRPIDELFEEGSSELRVGEGLVRRPGEVRVYTLSGATAPVSKVFRHGYSGELVRLKPLNAPELRLTPNHRVFAAHKSDPGRLEKVAAGDLTPEHYLAVPKRVADFVPSDLEVAALLARHESGPTRTRGTKVDRGRLLSALNVGGSSRQIGEQLGYHPTYVRKSRADLARGELMSAGSRTRTVELKAGRARFTGEHRPGIPATVPLDADLAWLLGLYAAEGHVRSDAARPNSHRLVFSMGPHEGEIVRRVSDMLRRLFNVAPQVVERRTTTTVEVGKSSLAVFFKTLCGTGAGAKRVPTAIFSAPERTVRSFLDGYLAGDGTVTQTHVVGNTVSTELAHGLYEIGLRLGVLPSIHRWVPQPEKVIEGRTVSQSPLWLVKFKRDRLNGEVGSREKTRWRDAGSHFLVPIHRIGREQYEGDVYNLEVDDPSHSYLAPAVAVANCQNFDVSWEVQGTEVSAERLAAMMLELQELGCHNINWVTPEHVVPQILEALPIAVGRGLRLPIVYNTSAYDSADSLELMDGVVDVYMPDLKLISSEHARRYLGKREYSDVMRRNVREMHRQVGALVVDERSGLARRGLICRHLVMPGLLDETEAVLRWVAEELGPGTYVNLMGQYYPAGKVGKNGRYEEIARRPDADELRRAFEIADSLGLRRLDKRSRREALAGA
jgi:putative pyruvate formate lyase activating enzyme